VKELEKERAAWDEERIERDAEVGGWRRRIGESERERDEWKGKWEKVVAEKEGERCTEWWKFDEEGLTLMGLDWIGLGPASARP
jgi:hypothetical protein